MNDLALQSLPETSKGHRQSFREQMALLAEAGYVGLQFAQVPTADQLSECRRAGLRVCGSGRVNQPSEARILAERLAGEGSECGTIHLGWGLEDDAEAYALVESVIEAGARSNVPLYIETHRATICQDIWRTVRLVACFPEMRFNGDFSHWYSGQEMVYGGFERKFAFIQPVIGRVRFLHGRIANPGCIQVPLMQGEPYVRHFEQLWIACFRQYLGAGDAGDSIIFAPELLAPDIYYARTFDGREETDRWQEMLLLKGMAERCFAAARSC
jgi:hypothetical protein